MLQYDAAGNRVLQQQFEQGTATINISGGEAGIYTALNAFEQPLSTRQTQYTNVFDDDNRLTQTFKNNVLSSTRAYNDLNQVTQYETFNDSGSRTFRQVSSYYADGTQSQTQDYNGSLSATGTNRFIYDNAGNISIVRLLNGNGSSAGTYTYTNISGNQGYQTTLIVANANGRSNTTKQIYACFHEPSKAGLRSNASICPEARQGHQKKSPKASTPASRTGATGRSSLKRDNGRSGGTDRKSHVNRIWQVWM